MCNQIQMSPAVGVRSQRNKLLGEGLLGYGVVSPLGLPAVAFLSEIKQSAFGSGAAFSLAFLPSSDDVLTSVLRIEFAWDGVDCV